MTRKLLLVSIAVAAMLFGCEDGGKPSTAQGAIADVDLAVPSDFAEEAEKSITPANYKAELDTLAKEIEAP